ncbi:MAG: very short patch repair endonuclease [Chloroflexota bacterium]|nr:very short patch repair endonuclease [Chloroflexota bacterium]
MRPDPLRSKIMRAVKSKDTAPELVVRRIAHRMGFRFRLHPPNLPGKPDLAFPRYRTAILVHGCFWHGHDCRRGSRTPIRNRDYWVSKIKRNQGRDERVGRELAELGWRVLVIWECQTKDPDLISAILRNGLSQSDICRDQDLTQPRCQSD